MQRRLVVVVVPYHGFRPYGCGRRPADGVPIRVRAAAARNGVVPSYFRGQSAVALAVGEVVESRADGWCH